MICSTLKYLLDSYEIDKLKDEGRYMDSSRI